MTNRTIWVCALAVSLVVFSVSMVPNHGASAPAPMRVSQLTPIHALTGVAFHSVAGF